MDAVLRRLRLKKGEPHESEARKRLQQDLFAFDKGIEQGFPYKPSALAYDSKLGLIAIGTKSGALRIYGQPGVQFYGQHKDDMCVTNVSFLPDQGRLITICADSSLHLWEINSTEDGYSTVDEISTSYVVEGSKPKTVASCCLSSNADHFYVGTDEGNLHVLDIPSFRLNGSVISQESLTETVLGEFRHNPGAIESIVQHPTSPNKILIGFEHGVIILWNVVSSQPENVYVSLQQLESLVFNRNGTEFISCHTDGSYIVWTLTEPNFPKEAASTPYGPFPCKAITKMEWKSTSHGSPFMIFSGGMTRASYGDRFTVSIMQGSSHVVLDFTSKVVNFVTLCDGDNQPSHNVDEPHSLIILLEEELVAVDLATPGWPSYRAPYLCSLHSSAITCLAHVTNTPELLWNKLCDVGRAQTAHCSQRPWPIQGGQNSGLGAHSRDLLLTGHEDGSVRFWDTSDNCLKLIYKLNTAPLFGVDALPHNDANNEDDWPPFRKIGLYDPFTEDPRLAVQKICLCTLSETLLLAGSAGQVVVLQFEREERDASVRVATVGVVGDCDSFVWRGHSALELRCCSGQDMKLAPGFQPICVAQLMPPATCISASLHSEWQLFAVGTAYGFMVFDYVQQKPVLSRCTLSHAVNGSGDQTATLSRRKSLQRSLRNSFHRLRRRQSEPLRPKGGRKMELINAEKKTDAHRDGSPAPSSADTSMMGTPSCSAAATSEHQTPVASAAVASAHTLSLNTSDSLTDATLSTVGCIYFADTFLLNGQSHTATLWVGTNAGCIYIHQLVIPPHDRRDADAVQCILAKEIRLRHAAPVVSLEVIDKASRPLPAPLEVQHERAKAPDMTGGHHVVVCSREQLKIFSLPALKPVNKYKLCDSAVSHHHEPLRLRMAAFAGFRGCTDETYVEYDLVGLLHNGEMCIFNVPALRRQMNCDVINRDNLLGMTLRVFTQSGKGFYLRTPSEVSHFSVSAHASVRPMCSLVLRDNVRLQLQAVPTNSDEPLDHNDDGSQQERPNVNGSQLNESAVSPPNESVSAADITTDSVQVHVSETSPAQVICAPAFVITTSIDKLPVLSTKADIIGKDGDWKTMPLKGDSIQIVSGSC